MQHIPIIDIHTHQIGNADIQLLNVVQYQPNRLISMGLHPWYLDKDTINQQLDSLTNLAKNDNVLAIGECGLDRNIALELSIQQSIFEAQIQLAQCLDKPVVIHCVRCFSELIAIKKRLKPHVPMIVHGFNNNQEILMQLLKNDFYISLGAALLMQGSNASKALNKIPNDRFFLETDDSQTSILAIYESAALQKQISLESLKLTVYDNFVSVFDRKSDIKISGMTNLK
jgi:TatD DNase family protein